MCAELGVVVPVIRIRDNIQLKPNEYMIKIRKYGGSWWIITKSLFSYEPGIDDDSISGIETTDLRLDCCYLDWWSDEERAELSGYTVVDPPLWLQPI